MVVIAGGLIWRMINKPGEKFLKSDGVLANVPVRFNIMGSFTWIMERDSGFARRKEVPVASHNEKVSEGMEGGVGDVFVKDRKEFGNLKSG